MLVFRDFGQCLLVSIGIWWYLFVSVSIGRLMGRTASVGVRRYQSTSVGVHLLDARTQQCFLFSCVFFVAVLWSFLFAMLRYVLF